MQSDESSAFTFIEEKSLFLFKASPSIHIQNLIQLCLLKTFTLEITLFFFCINSSLSLKLFLLCFSITHILKTVLGPYVSLQLLPPFFAPSQQNYLRVV